MLLQAAVSTDIDGNGCICVKPCAVLMRRALLPHMQRRRSGAVLLQAAMADPRAQHASVGRGTERADVPGMRCCCSCFGANGAAALVLMHAALSDRC